MCVCVCVCVCMYVYVVIYMSKSAYWLKMSLLNENVPTKRCLFKDHNSSY